MICFFALGQAICVLREAMEALSGRLTEQFSLHVKRYSCVWSFITEVLIC